MSNKAAFVDFDDEGLKVKYKGKTIIENAPTALPSCKYGIWPPDPEIILGLDGNLWECHFYHDGTFCVAYMVEEDITDIK